MEGFEIARDSNCEEFELLCEKDIAEFGVKLFEGTEVQHTTPREGRQRRGFGGGPGRAERAGGPGGAQKSVKQVGHRPRLRRQRHRHRHRRQPRRSRWPLRQRRGGRCGVSRLAALAPAPAPAAAPFRFVYLFI
ncbi:Protein of unknown function [Gryllus bimaculatus]|nr:Protein of unknown function [Gryllus bimaculatus]